jgi:hypothetical protein
MTDDIRPPYAQSCTKKLLRFGTDDPKCVDCKSTDTRILCQIERPGRRDLILCPKP